MAVAGILIVGPGAGLALADDMPVEYGMYVDYQKTGRETRFGCYDITNNSPTQLPVYVPLNYRPEWDGPFGILTRPPTGVTFQLCPGQTPSSSTPGSTVASPPSATCTGANCLSTQLDCSGSWQYVQSGTSRNGVTSPAYYNCTVNGTVLYSSSSAAGCCPGTSTDNGYAGSYGDIGSGSGGGEHGYDAVGNRDPLGGLGAQGAPGAVAAQGNTGTSDPNGSSPGGGDDD